VCVCGVVCWVWRVACGVCARVLYTPAHSTQPHDWDTYTFVTEPLATRTHVYVGQRVEHEFREHTHSLTHTYIHTYTRSLTRTYTTAC
jgi:hypothetical protein